MRKVLAFWILVAMVALMAFAALAEEWTEDAAEDAGIYDGPVTNLPMEEWPEGEQTMEVKSVDKAPEDAQLVGQDEIGGMPTVSFARVVTESGTLNMRLEGKAGAEVTAKIPKGAEVQVLADLGEWSEIFYKNRIGYVMSKYLKPYDDEDLNEAYVPITKDSESSAIVAVKRALYKLEYLKEEEVNSRFDKSMELALMKVQLVNGITLDPQTVSPELQALLADGLASRSKSGYYDTETDAETGLSVSIFCWDTGGMIFEEDNSFKVQITYAVQAMGGQAPYTITVKKSVGASGEAYGDVVSSPFSHIFGVGYDDLYLYATVVDANGDTVTACTPFAYRMPARYLED